LILRPLAQRLVLLDNDELLIDARFLLENESISKGSQIELPVHKVIIGDQIPQSSAQSSNISSKKSSDVLLKDISSETQVSPPHFNFARGAQFADDVYKKFGHSINFSPGFRKRPFFLVAAFGRSNFKLDVHTVSVALQVCFGGKASQFQVFSYVVEFSNLLWPPDPLGLKSIIQGKFQRKTLTFISFFGGEVVLTGNLRRKNTTWRKILNGLLFKDQKSKALENYRFSNGFHSLQKLSR
jgi:hypothetical protein